MSVAINLLQTIMATESYSAKYYRQPLAIFCAFNQGDSSISMWLATCQGHF